MTDDSLMTKSPDRALVRRIDQLWTDDAAAEAAGGRLAELLGLTVDPTINTSRGLASKAGLVRSVLDIFELY